MCGKAKYIQAQLYDMNIKFSFCAKDLQMLNRDIRGRQDVKIWSDWWNRLKRCSQYEKIQITLYPISQIGRYSFSIMHFLIEFRCTINCSCSHIARKDWRGCGRAVSGPAGPVGRLDRHAAHLLRDGRQGRRRRTLPRRQEANWLQGKWCIL